MKHAPATNDFLARHKAQAKGGLNPAQRFWKQYFSFYDTLNESAPYRLMIERHAELLEPGAADLILDAGTGTGNVAAALIERGAGRVIGIDFCEPALEICRAKAPKVEFRFGDLTKRLEFSSASFDKVACCCVLHVLERDAQDFAVKEMHRVLKSGGMVAITAFAAGFQPLKVYAETLRQRRETGGLAETVFFAIRYSIATVRILYYVLRIKRHEKRGDYDFFTPEELKQMLERAGFKVVLMERIFAFQCITALAKKPAIESTEKE